MSRSIYFLIYIIFPFQAYGDVWLPDIFTEGMVLQSGEEIKVWGNALPRERIAVTLRGRSAVTRADRAGNWEVLLQPLPSGGPYTLNILGKNLLTINNVWLGNVFILCGDTINFKNNAITETEHNANVKPYTAFFHVPQTPTAKPIELNKGEIVWQDASSNSKINQLLSNFSTETPTGFIISSYPNSPLKAWVNADTLRQFPQYQDSLASLEQLHILSSIGTIQKDRSLSNYPSVLFNGLIAPIAKYNHAAILFKGNYVDAPNAFYTGGLYQKLIACYRDIGQNNSADFLIINPPADLNYNKTEIAELLSVQQNIMGIKNVGFLNLFNKDKTSETENIGQALYSLSSESIDAFRLPNLNKVEIKEDKILLIFKNTNKWDFKSKYGYGRGFYLAEKNRAFLPAKALIINDSTIEISREDMSQPLAVRYAFNNYLLEGNFTYNRHPVLPFKTDYWAFYTDTSSFRTTWMPYQEKNTQQVASLKLVVDTNYLPIITFQPLNRITDRTKAIQTLKQLIGINKPRPLEIPISIKKIDYDSSIVKEQLQIQTDEDVYLDATWIYTKKKAKQPVLIIDKIVPQLTDSLTTTGFALLHFNPRQLLIADSTKKVEFLLASDSLNKPFIGQKIYDTQRIIDFLMTQKHIIDTNKIHFLQLDTMSKNRLDLLLATAIDERIKSLFLQQHLLNIKMSTIDTLKSGSTLLATDLHKYANIQDLIALVSPKKLTLLNPIKEDGDYLSLGRANYLTRKGRYAYYKKNISRNFNIKIGKDTSSGLTEALWEHLSK